MAAGAITTDSDSSSSYHFECVKKDIDKNALESVFYANSEVISMSVDQFVKQTERVDRAAEFLLQHDNAVGLIVYGKALKDICISRSFIKSFEVNIFLINNPLEDAEKDYPQMMIERIVGLAAKANAQSIHIQLLHGDTLGIEFFNRNSFEKISTCTNERNEAISHLFARNIDLEGHSAGSRKKRGRKLLHETVGHDEVGQSYDVPHSSKVLYP